jgi:cell division septal protein FtsQ
MKRGGSRSIFKIKRRKTSRARLFAYLFAFLVFASFVLWLALGLKVQKIKISGLVVLKKETIVGEVNEILNSKKWWGIFPKNNLLFFSKTDLTNRLLAKFRRIASLEISKDLLDSAIEIRVQEREPEAALCRRGEDLCFFVDKTGFVYEQAPLFLGELFLKFYDERSQKTKPGSFLLPEDDFARLIKFVNLFEKGFPELSVSSIVLETNGIYNFYTNEGWYFILDRKDDWGLVYENLTSVLNEVIQDERKNLEYLDLEFGNKVFYKFRN